MARFIPKDRASGKLAIYFAGIGLILVLVELAYFIGGLIQGIIVIETILPLFIGIIFLAIGISLIRYNIRKGAF